MSWKILKAPAPVFQQHKTWTGASQVLCTEYHNRFLLGETLKCVKHRGSTLIAPYRVFPVLPRCYHRFSNSGRAARWSTLHAARSSARGAAVAAAASRHILILVHGLINVLVLGLLGERVGGQRRGAVGSILRAAWGQKK